MLTAGTVLFAAVVVVVYGLLLVAVVDWLFTRSRSRARARLGQQVPLPCPPHLPREVWAPDDLTVLRVACAHCGQVLGTDMAALWP